MGFLHGWALDEGDGGGIDGTVTVIGQDISAPAAMGAGGAQEAALEYYMPITRDTTTQQTLLT